MNYEAIMFDLDGTLLPMDMDVFTKGYFKLLAGKLSPLGIAPDVLINTVWAGTKAMVKNDGGATNCEVFWKNFSQLTGLNEAPFRAASDEFYPNEFNEARRYAGENPLAAEAVRLARTKADKVVLATNPLFPRSGQLTRMSWIGLHETDFDMITSYETESACKPNPMYYSEICRKLNVNPVNCLMIGNDVREDMKTAYSLGMKCFLVTDCMIPCDDYEWNGPRGTFRELIEFLK